MIFEQISDSHVRIGGVNYVRLEANTMTANRFQELTRQVKFLELGITPDSLNEILKPADTFVAAPAKDMSATDVQKLKNELLIISHKIRERFDLGFGAVITPLQIACVLWLRDDEGAEYDAAFNNNVKMNEIRSSDESLDFFLQSGVAAFMRLMPQLEIDLVSMQLAVELLKKTETHRASLIFWT